MRDFLDNAEGFNIDKALDAANLSDARSKRCKEIYKEISSKMIDAGDMEGAKEVLFSYIKDFNLQEAMSLFAMTIEMHKLHPGMQPMVASVHVVTVILMYKEEDKNNEDSRTIE